MSHFVSSDFLVDSLVAHYCRRSLTGAWKGIDTLMNGNKVEYVKSEIVVNNYFRIQTFLKVH